MYKRPWATAISLTNSQLWPGQKRLQRVKRNQLLPGTLVKNNQMPVGPHPPSKVEVASEVTPVIKGLMLEAETALVETAEMIEDPLTFRIKNASTAIKRDISLVSAQISKMGEAEGEVVPEKGDFAVAEVVVLAVSVGLSSASDVAKKVISRETAHRKIQGLSEVTMMEAEVVAVVLVEDTSTGIVPK